MAASTKMPPDVRAHVYGMAQERAEAASRLSTGTEELPVAEASRRQRMLRLFRLLGSDSQLLLMYFYFKAFNFEKVAGKMGYANANVARLQKANCLRKLYEIMNREPGGPAVPAGASALGWLILRSLAPAPVLLLPFPFAFCLAPYDAAR